MPKQNKQKTVNSKSQMIPIIFQRFGLCWTHMLYISEYYAVFTASLCYNIKENPNIKNLIR